MGRWVMGQLVTWVAIIRWVTWIMGQWVLTHDPSIFGWAACGDWFCCIMFKSNKTCDLSVMKSCVFTVHLSDGIPISKASESLSRAWLIFCVLFPIFRCHHQHILTASSTMLYHGSWVIWVMDHGSYGSWVKYSAGHMGHGSLEVTHRLPWLEVELSVCNNFWQLITESTGHRPMFLFSHLTYFMHLLYLGKLHRPKYLQKILTKSWKFHRKMQFRFKIFIRQSSMMHEGC